MNRIEVQLAQDKQVLEFDKPVKSVSIPNSRFCFKWCTPIAVLFVGIFIGHIYSKPKGLVYDPLTHRCIPKATAKLMLNHGLHWCREHKRLEKNDDSPDFPILDFE